MAQDPLITHVVSLSWLRCAMEEGTDFVNKVTGDIETNEVVIYSNLQSNTGLFDLPASKCSPKGLEKNLLEVIGNLVVHNESQQIKESMLSPEFSQQIKDYIARIRAREFSGKVPSKFEG